MPAPSPHVRNLMEKSGVQQSDASEGMAAGAEAEGEVGDPDAGLEDEDEDEDEVGLGAGIEDLL